MLNARLLILTAIVAAASVSHGQSAGPDIDRSQLRSYPAGPFSTVSTSFGGLETSVPLFSLSGPGGTSISFGLRHRSNQIIGTQYYQRSMGRGWFHSYDNMVRVSGNNIMQDVAGSGGQLWANGTPVAGLYGRRAGTRDDLRDILSQAGAWLGWEVDEFPSRNKLRYLRINGDLQKNVTYLSAVVDP